MLDHQEFFAAAKGAAGALIALIGDEEDTPPALAALIEVTGTDAGECEPETLRGAVCDLYAELQEAFDGDEGPSLADLCGIIPAIGKPLEMMTTDALAGQLGEDVSISWNTHVGPVPFGK